MRHGGDSVPRAPAPARSPARQARCAGRAPTAGSSRVFVGLLKSRAGNENSARLSAGRGGVLGSGSGLAPSLLHSQVAAITASRAEALALGVRLREAEAARSTAEAEVAALHDQAAVRAAEGDRCVRPHIMFVSHLKVVGRSETCAAQSCGSTRSAILVKPNDAHPPKSSLSRRQCRTSGRECKLAP